MVTSLEKLDERQDYFSERIADLEKSIREVSKNLDNHKHKRLSGKSFVVNEDLEERY